MREEDFAHFLGPLPEPYLLVAPTGELLAINPAAARVLELDAAPARGVDLAGLAPGAAEATREYLRACAGSASFLAGSLVLGEAGAEHAVHCEGCALPNPADRGAQPAVLLRLKPRRIPPDPLARADQGLRRLLDAQSRLAARVEELEERTEELARVAADLERRLCAARERMEPR